MQADYLLTTQSSGVMRIPDMQFDNGCAWLGEKFSTVVRPQGFNQLNLQLDLI